MPFGISDLHFNQIISVLDQNQYVISAMLFGSRAKGNFKPGSDVDIALIGAELTLKDVFNLQNQLDDYDQPYIFDLILYDSITEPALISHIHRVGIEIYHRTYDNN